MILTLASFGFASQENSGNSLAAFDANETVHVIVQLHRSVKGDQFSAAVDRLEKIAERWNGKKTRQIRLMKCANFTVKGAAVAELSADPDVARVTMDHSLRNAVAGR